jgi:putative endopeptidase
MTRSRLFATVAFSILAVSAQAATTPNFGSWGFDLAGQDRTVKPGDNFFEFANGNAVKGIVIPADRTNFGAFVELADLSEQRVHGILDDASAKAAGKPDDAMGKAGAIFKAFMDETSVEALGAAPLQKDLAAIKAVQTAADFAALQGRAQSGFQGSLFAMDIEPDAKDPTKYGINLGQAGLGLPDRDYYLTLPVRFCCERRNGFEHSRQGRLHPER